MRLALLNLELQDRSLQRRLIDPPPKFADGPSSIGDSDRVRMEKVKLYFPAAFGGRKFTGKKNREVGIIELLNDANNAQTVLHITEMEFIQFLAKSMAGEAHTTMINYLDLCRRKQMSITDIYLSLTDLYYTEMRPAVALEKLQSLNDYNHSYSSLSEAHNGILYLANLASLASRSADRQEALCADYYQQALLRIMPKEYRALSSAAFEQCGNLKRADLSPHEMLSCLNKLRHPIDDALRRTANKIDRNKDRNQALGRKGVKIIKNAIGDRRSDKTRKDSDSISSKPKEKRRASVKEVRASRGTQKKDSNKNEPKKKENNSPYDPLCKLCGSDGHPADNCEAYPVGQRMVGCFPCPNCDGKLYHYSRFCHKTRSNQKN